MQAALVIAVGAAAWVVTALALRTRLPAAAVTTLLALSAMGVAAGGLLAQDTATTPDWLAALAVMAFAGPFQARISFGAFGRFGRSSSGTVGPDRRGG